MATSRVKVRDNGATKIVRELGKRGPGVRVGVLGEKGGAQHKGSPAGITVAEIAEIHEFGLGVPERSWLRDWIDANTRQIADRIRREEAEVVKGKRTREQAIKRLGVWIQGEIQQRIADGIPPPNAPSTIAKKGSSKPLIDTGQLRQSITHKIVP